MQGLSDDTLNISGCITWMFDFPVVVCPHYESYLDIGIATDWLSKSREQ